MLTISLQSGSSGNCIYVETGDKKLLFDAGISGLQAKKRLESFGRDISEVDALIISHDHADHVRHAGVFQRKFGIPIYISPLTLDNSLKRHKLGRLLDVEYFRPGESIQFGNITVNTIPCPHDGVDGSVFTVSSGNKSLGIWTDLGHVFEDLKTAISSLDAIYIESNYDPDMLENGPYPVFLKQRIKSPRGHLSNMEAAELLQAGSGLKWACLAHLSKNNNDPRIAMKTHRDVSGDKLPLYAADRFTASGAFTI